MKAKKKLAYNARRIREVRESKKMTQMKMAVKTGLSIVTISNIEKGIKEPRISTLAKISKALDKPTSFFINND